MCLNAYIALLEDLNFFLNNHCGASSVNTSPRASDTLFWPQISCSALTWRQNTHTHKLKYINDLMI